jgi:RNA polymerase sigma-70 factor (ECF subfamily)
LQRLLVTPDTGNDRHPEQRTTTQASGAARADVDERFTRLVLEHERRIYRFVFGMVASEPLAEDLTQDVFFLAYRALDRLPDDANESAWLFTIARNRALQELRRRKIVRWVPLAGPRDEEDSHPDLTRPLAEAVAERDYLQRAMDRVPAKDLACLLLSVDGHSYNEVAEITGLSTPAVRARIFRARERLRSLLTEASRPAQPADGAYSVVASPRPLPLPRRALKRQLPRRRPATDAVRVPA